MKAYIKILSITAVIQAFSYLLSRLAAHTLTDCIFLDLPILITAAGIITSIIAGAYLSFKWYDTRKKSLLCFFLLPTNYTWLIGVYIVFRFLVLIYDTFIDLLP